MKLKFLKAYIVITLFVLLNKESIGQSQDKLNVLMIAVDDLKPLIGCYGDAKAITPNLDKLGLSGTVFLNNHCQQAVSAPSRASLLTGKRPDNTKVWDLETIMRDYVSNIVTLPQYLKNNGYETAATGKVFDPRSVDYYHDKVSWTIPYVDKGDGRWIYATGKPSVEAPNAAESEFTDTKLLNHGVELLDQLSSKGKPFFLAVGFHKPHLPFVAPKKYWDLYQRSSFEINKNQKYSLNGVDIAYHESGELRGYDDIPDIGDISENQQKELIHGYYACVSYIDNLIGQLIDKLEKLGEKDKTVIVLWGDHGWHLGDHGLWAKHTNFENATRSPLIIYSPKVSGNKKSSSPTEFVDVFPTICQLANVEIPTNLDGKSLVPIMQSPTTKVKDFAVSQYHRKKGALEVEGYALRTDRYRYVEWLEGKYQNDKPYDENKIYAKELYDYTTDPEETINLAADPKASSLVTDFHQNMKTFFETLKITPINPPNTKSENLLANPGFEEGVGKWNLSVWGGNEAKVEETTTAFEGIKAALIKVTIADPTNIGKTGLLSDSLVNVKQGKYKLTAKVKGSINGLPFRLSLRCFNSSNDVKYYASNDLLLTTSYQEYSWEVTPDASYLAKINVRLQCGKAVGDYYLDNIELTQVQSTTVPTPSGRRLREIIKEKYPEGNLLIGGTTGVDLIGSTSGIILNREFSFITPDNDFKQTAIHPEPGVWDWTKPDKWIAEAAANNQIIRMHSPISPQCSEWARDDKRTAAELKQNLEEYMTELCKRYNSSPQVKWMDVVNETVDKTTGNWFGPKTGIADWENPWPNIGYDETDPLKPPLYIKLAFEIANKNAPNIKQIINQHGEMETAAWDKVKATVKYLRNKGLRIDGIGWQAHIDVGWEKVGDNLKKLGELIDWAHANNLAFHITENNVACNGVSIGNWTAQAETFGALVKMIRDKRKSGLVSWNLWQITDADGQKAGETPAMFFADGSAKPAYYKVQSILEDNTVSVETVEELPASFELYQNYPNPFNPTTKIKYAIPAGASEIVTIKIYDAVGRFITTLVDEVKPVGIYEAFFNGQNLASGAYFCHLRYGNYNKAVKLLLLK